LLSLSLRKGKEKKKFLPFGKKEDGKKSEPTVISRGFFHQSKNEQLCFVTVVVVI